MKRITTVAVLAFAGLLGVAATASADLGDVRQLTIDDNLFGSASQVEVTGTIRCQASIDYGLWAGVGQTGDDPHFDTFLAQSPEGDQTFNNADAEGVGAFGPNFDPPVGMSDDQPCSQSLSSYDVLVQQNRGSGDFEGDPGDNDRVGAVVVAGTSAENGGRGPGPFIADFLLVTGNAFFERVR